MSKKHKSQNLNIEPLVTPELISIKDFLHNCIFNKKIQSWQEKEVYLFFKDLGLGEKEPVDSYIEALSKY